ncbi:hypothetical protein FEM48_Zijuj11G0141200 [Ziziphus jujuba var. spinosa]|uniref:Uncharacterized protein n=1 Tax=Ziziphus jujuba var. spinosa TaxID=714518 RepID=A0A978UJD7_ZIZJJ|nr:hypothetical protein FEM48_Zijuj11G0141200 [Ziziphus jujuba var. spinosa]
MLLDLSELQKDVKVRPTRNLEDIMQNILSLMGITQLDLDGTAIKTLPESIWMTSGLERLLLEDCPNIEKLLEISDDSMSSSLQWLDIRGCQIEEYYHFEKCRELDEHTQNNIIVGRLCRTISFAQIPLTGDRLCIHRFETERDHVFIRNVHIDLKDVFGEEWSSVCSNVTEASFRVAIQGKRVINWEIKNFGLELVNNWVTAWQAKVEDIEVERLEMGIAPELVPEPYLAALEGDWERMKRFYEENREALFYPLTVTNETPFHIAVYSRTKSPLEELIQIVPNPPIARAGDKKNTPLHEAGAIGNIKAAQVLMRWSPEQLEARNALGETPMFRAAAFGMTEMEV